MIFNRVIVGQCVGVWVSEFMKTSVVSVFIPQCHTRGNATLPQSSTVYLQKLKPVRRFGLTNPSTVT